MKNLIIKKAGNSIEGLLKFPVLINPALKEKYISSPARIKALEIAFQKNHVEKKNN